MRVQANRGQIARALRRGLAAFGAPAPLTLRQWAERHFYLSAESSYVEQHWQAWPFQRAILSCIGNDDVQEVDILKSARVGYTKILLAAIGFFAQHKQRNQALWQPTDSDRDEFVKTELDPMLRDVAVMHPIFPARLSRHKDNTLLIKKFLGGVLHLRGGKSAGNYRRISIGVAYLDEFSSFDPDIDGEGDPGTLAAKRLEGATFPKMVIGSTPKEKGTCLMEKRAESAQARYEYHIACPHCGGHHALTWGGKDETHGFKWVGRDADSVRHLCPHCSVLITQAEYLAAAESGFWYGSDGSTIDQDGVFRDRDGVIMAAHEHIAFHVWTAYSPAVQWSEIVQAFLDAYEKAEKGDGAELKTFWNTTLGRTWEGAVEKIELDELKRRAEIEAFALPGRGENVVPMDCLLLLTGLDTQDNRIEACTWGFGRGSQMWTVDHQIFFGNPEEDKVWKDVAQYLFESRFVHEGGQQMAIYASAIDSGGHHTNAVYEFARKNKARRVFAVRGRPFGEKSINDGGSMVDIDWRGRRVKKGVVLWHVGTNLAKDLLHSRLKIEREGAGYIHLAGDLSDEWFRQFSGEVRATRKTATGSRTIWTAMRKRVEALDCTVYALWLEARLNLQRKTDAWWQALADKLGAELVQHDEPPDEPAPTKQEPKQPAPAKAGVSVSTPARRATRRAASSSYLRGRR
ncbi:terminase [Allopusillimonas soli]|uniref:Phage terminase large subunit family protein n=1 Tax=Allopusillimonas soli TaxID=659016 RepID=A0A853FJG6_9BURK|nr:terminase gpA endonuclease subunit [Allopusillimonas soli]NYT38880.1 phage terminase large subunit family protein [Allopusillimonas soli]TEA70121.1 terminase [Allopusillimonas soli]